MSYVVNTGDDKECEKCKKRIGVSKGFYTQWGRILCPDCSEMFVEYFKNKFNDFILEKENSENEICKENGHLWTQRSTTYKCCNRCEIPKK